MIKENCIILTGAPGSGKSTILKLLRQSGCACIDEPAREIISEQRLIGGFGVYDRNPSLFLELMLSRAISRFKAIDDTSQIYIFDRGVPDNLAYAALFKLKFDHGWSAAKEFRCNSRVFFAPNWREIYTTDEERTMSFDASCEMGDSLRAIYKTLGYTVVDLPLSSAEERVDFILINAPRAGTL